jgi:hypothetical protein
VDLPGILAEKARRADALDVASGIAGHEAPLGAAGPGG